MASDDGDELPIKVRQSRPLGNKPKAKRSEQRGNFDAVRSTEFRLGEMQQQIGDLKSSVNSLIQHFENLQSRSPTPPRNTVRSRSPSPARGRCYHCQGLGHFANNCPSKKAENKAARPQVTFSEDLNETGSGQKA